MSTTTTATLAIDAGQTGIKARLTSSDGALRDLGFAGIRTDKPLLPQLAGVVVAVADETHERIGVTSFGVSGLTREATRPDELLSSLQPVGVREVNLAHDSIGAYLGAMGDRPGVVVASGTGVVTLGVGPRGAARVDGWGYLIGDAGSGYWIGRAALDAVLRAHDGRGPETALTAIAQREFADLEAAYIDLQSDDGRVRRIAAYSKVVGELAATDAVSAAIMQQAGSELAGSVIAAAARSGADAEPALAVRCVGNVFHSRELTEAFGAAVTAAVPAADIRTGESNPLDGVDLLPSIGTDNPLHASIATARA